MRLGRAGGVWETVIRSAWVFPHQTKMPLLYQPAYQINDLAEPDFYAARFDVLPSFRVMDQLAQLQREAYGTFSSVGAAAKIV